MILPDVPLERAGSLHGDIERLDANVIRTLRVRSRSVSPAMNSVAMKWPDSVSRSRRW